jgi:hypothetical protein
MTKTQGRNNRLLGCAVALAVFLCAIPVKWFTITNPTLEGLAGIMAQAFRGMSFNLNGLNGTINFLVSVPIWLLLGISAFSIIVIVLNTLEVTALPRIVPALGLIIPGIYYVIPFFGGADCSIGPGPIMALLATVLGLILTFKKTRPVDQPQETVA